MYVQHRYRNDFLLLNWYESDSNVATKTNTIAGNARGAHDVVMLALRLHPVNLVGRVWCSHRLEHFSYVLGIFDMCRAHQYIKRDIAGINYDETGSIIGPS